MSNFYSGKTRDSHPIIFIDDTENPLPECPSSPNCVRKTLQIKRSLARTGTAVLSTLQQMHASSVNTTANDYEWQAVFRVFIFKDDFTVRLKPANGSTLMHIRSASRIGGYDFGVNKRRVKVFIKIISCNFTV